MITGTPTTRMVTILFIEPFVYIRITKIVLKLRHSSLGRAIRDSSRLFV